MHLKLLVVCVALSASAASARSIFDDDLKHARIARGLVHKANWTSMGTISTAEGMEGFPMVNVISIADSPLNGKSTGRIFYLLTDLDFTGKDLHVNNKITALFTEDQDLTCTNKGVDSMEPTCSRVIITGHNRIVNENDKDYSFIDSAFTSRHPASTKWRESHSFYYCELGIEKIALLDFYGGPKHITPADYFRADPDVEPSVLFNLV